MAYGGGREGIEMSKWFKSDLCNVQLFVNDPYHDYIILCIQFRIVTLFSYHTR